MDDSRSEIWMPTQFIMVPVNALSARERNPRLHSPEKIRALADMILRFGWTVPIVVEDGGVVLAGHARLAAAHLLKLVSVPVIEAKHLSESQRRAYVIADNRIAEASAWDEEMLAAELRALQSIEGGLESAGFSMEDLESLEADMRGEAPEAVPGGAHEAPSGAPPGYGDPANEKAAEGYSSGVPVIQYAMVFGDEEQQHIFFRFLGFLRRSNAPGTGDTERLVEHCHRIMEAAGYEQ